MAPHCAEKHLPYSHRAPQIEKVPVATVTACSRGDFSKNLSYPLRSHRRATRVLGLGVLRGGERVLPPTACREELHHKPRFAHRQRHRAAQRPDARTEPRRGPGSSTRRRRGARSRAAAEAALCAGCDGV